MSDRNVSKWDVSLKEFVGICEQLEAAVDALTLERDLPHSNSDFYEFKREVVKMKNIAIVESYNRGCFEWKFGE